MLLPERCRPLEAKVLMNLLSAFFTPVFFTDWWLEGPQFGRVVPSLLSFLLLCESLP